jgi:uncharacterized protein YprB with RNaseH-like and TPR domain
MNFRDKLSRLSAPISRSGLQSVASVDAATRLAALQSAGSLEPELIPEPGEIVRVMEQLASKIGAEDDARVFAVRTACDVETDEDRGARIANARSTRMSRTARDVESDADRAERIANLRSLIGDVLARGAVWRSPRAATQIGRSAAEFASSATNDLQAVRAVREGTRVEGDSGSVGWQEVSGSAASDTTARPHAVRLEPALCAPARDGFESDVAAVTHARSDARVRAATERARAAWAKAHASSDSSESASIAVHESSSATAPSGGAVRPAEHAVHENFGAVDTSGRAVLPRDYAAHASFGATDASGRATHPRTVSRTRADSLKDGESGLESRSSILNASERVLLSAGDGTPATHERATARAPYFAPPIATASADALRAALDGWIPARIRAPHPRSRLPWATRETSRGPVHVVERWLEPNHQHGNTAVRGAIDRLPATLAALALDPALATLDLSRMLFLDTETTGLAGGSGTVAFLVGLASFDDASLRLEQLLVPNLGGEVPMLVALAERLAAASCMLTYNGKSFDWPLLRTRYVMNRLSVPALPPHVDLLHATRRVWKPRLGSLRLTEIERQIMRFFREDDLDGAEIPGRYFSFLQDGGSEGLLPVLEHNQNDLIALPAMLGALGERFELVQCGEHALDALAFGKLALRALDPARAEAFARAAIAASDGDPLAPQAWTFGGEVARRAGEMPAAIRHFEQALQLCEDPERSASLHIVLAKLYEHALRDLVRAYDHARFTEPAEGAESHGRRLGRLTRKLEREAQRLRTRRA